MFPTNDAKLNKRTFAHWGNYINFDCNHLIKHLCLTESADEAVSRFGGLYEFGLEVTVSSCHKSPTRRAGVSDAWWCISQFTHAVIQQHTFMSTLFGKLHIVRITLLDCDPFPPGLLLWMTDDRRRQSWNLRDKSIWCLRLCFHTHRD